MTRTLVVAAAALALAAPAAARLPFFQQGSVVGEGMPLKAYATVTPTVHLFGDTVTARLAVVADTKWVEPERLRVRTSFAPYRPVRRPTVTLLGAGRFAQVTWTWTLQCLTSPCAPRLPPSERYRDFRFRTIRIDYLRPGGRPAYGLTASWPKVEVQTQVSPGVRAYMEATKRFRWQLHTTPVAAPSYRFPPPVLAGLALGLAGLLALAAAALVWRWYRALRPRAVEPPARPLPASTLERALALLAVAHARGDEVLERKLLERVAGEVDADELTRLARELAWSPDRPDDADVRSVSEQAREASE